MKRSDGDSLVLDPFPKRSRPADYSKYPIGSIVRVICANFVTYDYCDCEPAPGLNVVVGPNGSGKSTIISAICLGLAGKHKLLDKGDGISTFIKHGKDFADIKIHLHKGDNRVLVIHRRIESDNKTLWKLDDRSVQEKKVIDEIRRYNIQLDNLCQFLPQERVVEFARMDPMTLLHQTEAAIHGEASLREKQALIMREKDIKKRKESHTLSVGKLDKLKKEQAQAETEAARFREKQEILKHIEWISSFKVITECNNMEAEFREAQGDIKERETLLKKSEAELAPREKDLRALKQEQEEIKTKR